MHIQSEREVKIRTELLWQNPFVALLSCCHNRQHHCILNDLTSLWRNLVTNPFPSKNTSTFNYSKPLMHSWNCSGAGANGMYDAIFFKNIQTTEDWIGSSHWRPDACKLQNMWCCKGCTHQRLTVKESKITAQWSTAFRKIQIWTTHTPSTPVQLQD